MFLNKKVFCVFPPNNLMYKTRFPIIVLADLNPYTEFSKFAWTW